MSLDISTAMPLKRVRLFVGNIPNSMTEDDLRKLFEGHTSSANIVSVFIVRFHSTGQSKGCAFVVVAGEDIAQALISSVHESCTFPTCSRPIQVCLAKSSQSDRSFVTPSVTIAPAYANNTDVPSVKLFVSNFLASISSVELFQLFNGFSSVIEVVVLRNASGNLKGCGFVRLADHSQALECIRAFSGQVIPNFSVKPLVVRFANQKSNPVAAPQGVSLPYSNSAHGRFYQADQQAPQQHFLPLQSNTTYSQSMLVPPAQRGYGHHQAHHAQHNQSISLFPQLGLDSPMIGVSPVYNGMMNGAFAPSIHEGCGFEETRENSIFGGRPDHFEAPFVNLPHTSSAPLSAHNNLPQATSGFISLSSMTTKKSEKSAESAANWRAYRPSDRKNAHGSSPSSDTDLIDEESDNESLSDSIAGLVAVKEGFVPTFYD